MKDFRFQIPMTCLLLSAALLLGCETPKNEVVLQRNRKTGEPEKIIYSEPQEFVYPASHRQASDVGKMERGYCPKKRDP
jgi:hypothetical protein